MTPPGQDLTITAIVPTFNRREQLLRCLAALGTQSLPASRYDIVVVDDGSTDRSGEAVGNLALPGPVSYYAQANLGPAAARNHGISVARGDLLLFLGDDVIAEPRLLEEHVAAHQRHPESAAAVLGRLDWPEWRPRTALMDYVCGPGQLQFAFADIGRMPRLDYRFFYTSNVSLKRAFLADTGELFDETFRCAAFEDTELAYRLQQHGLRLHYADSARAVHDHAIDVDGFVRREERAGEMAVNLYRKHPELDHVAQVRSLTKPLQAVDRLMASTIVDRLVEAAVRADGVLRRIAQAIDTAEYESPLPGTPNRAAVVATALRHDLWFVVFSAARLRGKVRALVGPADGARLAAAEALLSGIRELDFFVRAARQLAAIAQPDDAALLPSLAAEAVHLKREVSTLVGMRLLETGGLLRRFRRLATRPSVSSALRSLDVSIEARLEEWNLTRALARYRALRGAVKRRLS